jgi:hypothetical protein
VRARLPCEFGERKSGSGKGLHTQATSSLFPGLQQVTNL